MARSDDKQVTRIKSGSSSAKKRAATPTKKTSRNEVVTSTEPKRGPISAFLGYFSGAWYELRQVHWPTRRATWGLTGAVLAFSAFFVVVILLLDALFKYLFETILK